MESKFKRIAEYNNYSVSYDGRVFSHELKRELKLTEDKDGYMQARLKNSEGKVKTVAVHRLVAISFIPNLENLPFVNHLDNNKKNNHFSNLEWCDNKRNNTHYIKYFFDKRSASESLLTDIETLLERALLGRDEDSETIQKIIELFKLSDRTKLKWHFREKEPIN